MDEVRLLELQEFVKDFLKSWKKLPALPFWLLEPEGRRARPGGAAAVRQRDTYRRSDAG
jgi:endo-1,4-beta-mannosidase